MQLGFVSAILPDQTLEEVFTIGKATGYTCVELMCWPVGKADRRYAGVTHIDVTNFNQAEVPRILDLAKAQGMGISGPKMLNLTVVSTFVGRDWTRSVEGNWPHFLSVWRDLIAYAEDQEVRIAIENCPMIFTADEWPGGKNLASSPAIWRRMFEEIPSANFGLNYDPSHQVWQQMDHVAPLKEFASRIFRVHLKDVAVD